MFCLAGMQFFQFLTFIELTQAYVLFVTLKLEDH